jgi:hypothetical protein
MHSELQQRLSQTIGQQPDWFWEWVEINHRDEEALTDWFHAAPSEDMIVFWKTYFSEVLGQLPTDYEHFFLSEEEDALFLNEDDMADFNNWVIVQGKAIWEAVCKLTARMEDTASPADIALLRKLFQISRATQSDHVEGLVSSPTTWAGVTWTPRWGYFPGDTADFIFEERFGETLWEQLA